MQLQYDTGHNNLNNIKGITADWNAKFIALCENSKQPISQPLKPRFPGKIRRHITVQQTPDLTYHITTIKATLSEETTCFITSTAKFTVKANFIIKATMRGKSTCNV